ncbi:RNA dependent RNA polymerase-domain-containing protein [Mycena belliarum]|uniref:RNA-dependent RNA polymerase n=1 Tax=Mycena belliarum TaxID=1033014 RepID=A0AAD6XH57_9AGAR|nr:RNA dependent RNA polymerase-domain-containing protein [Mycena belliae]
MSQIKINYSKDSKDAQARSANATIDILWFLRTHLPACISPKVIINLEHNRVSVEVFIAMQDTSIAQSAAVEESEGMYMAWCVREAEGEARFRGFGDQYGNTPQDKNEEDELDSFDLAVHEQLTPWWPDYISGCPSLLAETVMAIIDLGFTPQSLTVRWDKLKQIVCKKIKGKANTLEVQHPWGGLEDDQIHFESWWHEFHVDKVDTHTVLGKVLVKTVRHPKLADKVGVIVCSVKGQQRLLDFLPGGDYDGDTAIVIWDKTMVDPFMNAAEIFLVEPQGLDIFVKILDSPKTGYVIRPEMCKADAELYTHFLGPAWKIHVKNGTKEHTYTNWLNSIPLQRKVDKKNPIRGGPSQTLLQKAQGMGKAQEGWVKAWKMLLWVEAEEILCGLKQRRLGSKGGNCDSGLPQRTGQKVDPRTSGEPASANVKGKVLRSSPVMEAKHSLALKRRKGTGSQRLTADLQWDCLSVQLGYYLWFQPCVGTFLILIVWPGTGWWWPPEPNQPTLQWDLSSLCNGLDMDYKLVHAKATHLRNRKSQDENGNKQNRGPHSNGRACSGLMSAAPVGISESVLRLRVAELQSLSTKGLNAACLIEMGSDAGGSSFTNPGRTDGTAASVLRLKTSLYGWPICLWSEPPLMDGGRLGSPILVTLAHVGHLLASTTAAGALVWCRLSWMAAAHWDPYTLPVACAHQKDMNKMCETPRIDDSFKRAPMEQLLPLCVLPPGLFELPPDSWWYCFQGQDEALRLLHCQNWQKQKLDTPNKQLVAAKQRARTHLGTCFDGLRGEVPAEEAAILRALLEAARGVKHLTVTCNIWAHFQSECGALELRSLYLIRNRVYKISRPTLNFLQHPDALVDLTFYAPKGLLYVDLWRSTTGAKGSVGALCTVGGVGTGRVLQPGSKSARSQKSSPWAQK